MQNPIWVQCHLIHVVSIWPNQFKFTLIHAKNLAGKCYVKSRGHENNLAHFLPRELNSHLLPLAVSKCKLLVACWLQVLLNLPFIFVKRIPISANERPNRSR